VKYRELIKILEKDGWTCDRQRASHRQFRHPTKPGTVTVAGHPRGDVPAGTLANIFRQAGIERRGVRRRWS
jgi:predicted RNA binding protein YcfA (HicA-like mRNA interferase family)